MITIDKNFKFCVFNIGQQVSKEEINEEINRLELEKVNRDNLNSALKIYLNSIYGVVGYVYFITYNKDVAETITSISRDLIKYTIKIFNAYFKKYWHRAFTEHEKIGISKFMNVDFDVINYCDTDSVMAVLEDVYCNTDFYERFINGKIQYDNILKKYKYDYDYETYIKNKEKFLRRNPDEKFVDDDFMIKMMFYLKLDHYCLSPFTKKMLKVYLSRYNAFQEKPDGYDSLILSLEQINDFVLWTGKKHYIKNPVWDDGKILKPLEDIQVKGLEMNQKSIPEYVRGKLKDIIYYILERKGVLDMNHFLKMMKKVREEFMLIETEEIIKTMRVNTYGKYILRDTTDLEIAPNTPEHTKAAAIYNYLLYNSKYKSKYKFLKEGDRIQYYHTNDSDYPVFGYHVGVFPYEFALNIAREKQFDKILMSPVNNITKVIDEQLYNLNNDLIIMPSF
jgi:DNA polymerase elongation subunit (family B)